jgi:hypothetical protein
LGAGLALCRWQGTAGQAGGCGLRAATKVYWTAVDADVGKSMLMAVPIDGGLPTTLASGQLDLGHIAVDATSVYYAPTRTS